jgi:hypothetical protein
MYGLSTSCSESQTKQPFRSVVNGDKHNVQSAASEANWLDIDSLALSKTYQKKAAC